MYEIDPLLCLTKADLAGTGEAMPYHSGDWVSQDTPVIIMTAFGNLNTAVRAVEGGARPGSSFGPGAGDGMREVEGDQNRGARNGFQNPLPTA